MDKTEKDESLSPISLLVFLSLLIILSWVTILRDLYSSFRLIPQIFIDFFYGAWKFWNERKATIQEASIHKLCTHENVDGEKLSGEVEMVLKEVGDENKLSVGEVKIVMEKLGTLCDDHPDAENYEEGMGPDEIAGLFEEEPSPEEVKEAFDIFDENNDGFIDAGELGRVLCSLGLMEPLEVECQRMIRVFDDNGDGRIDFKEFVKLVEHSFY
ncbi:probable calcium-binding protein CML47 [Quercus suber]|uniref:probable calcium-binding protein CML47 n=1 Tax=Quercus suber TaxID=58331 RepID=UPI000CE18AAF|nr:probable calcium-binding protein CML47 [Quercus suber]POE68323.1 putative calcium-binding protein cml45 [Quercus suber]